MNPNSLLYWFPLIEDIKGIGIPRTVSVAIPPEAFWDILDGDATEFEARRDQIEEAAKRIGYPLFMRTDLISGKHSWRDACYVPDESILFRHIFGLAEANGMADLDSSALVFRQLLQPWAGFTAFSGELPIGVEKRYFVKDGKVLCSHAYWPEDAIINPSREDWQAWLAAQNGDWGERRKLKRVASEVSHRVPGFWSVDFFMDENRKWWLIDMALGDESWHPAHTEEGNHEVS